MLGEYSRQTQEWSANPITCVRIPQRKNEAATGGSTKVRPVASENVLTTPQASCDEAHRPGTRDSGHLSIRGHQVLQAMLWVPAHRGVITHLPWTLGMGIGEKILLNHTGTGFPPEMLSPRFEGLERSTVSAAENVGCVSKRVL